MEKTEEYPIDFTGKKTSDGTVFSDASEAELHESSLRDVSDINAFLDGTEAFNRKGQRTRAENIIREFLKYCRIKNTGEPK